MGLSRPGYKDFKVATLYTICFRYNLKLIEQFCNALSVGQPMRSFITNFMKINKICGNFDQFDFSKAFDT